MNRSGDSDQAMEERLQATYERRVIAASASAEFAARIDAVPADVRPDRPRWVRLGTAVLWPIGAVAIALVALPLLRRLSGTSLPSTIGSATVFDPAHPGGGLAELTGVTFDGIGYVVFVLAVVVLGLMLTVGVLARFILPPKPKPKPPPVKRSRGGRLLSLLAKFVLFVVVVGGPRIDSLDPLGASSPITSGIGLTQTRSDGISSTGLGDKSYWLSTHGPRSIYAVAPGQPLTYLVSVRNNWPIGIRLIGRWTEGHGVTDISDPPGSTPSGLGLLRDPSRLDTSIIPFAPIDIAPGAEVTIVVAEVGRSCADPSVSVPIRPSGPPRLLPTIDFVWEAFGVEGVGSIVLSPEVTVPSTCPAT